ncbi:ATPase WRNIP1 isoform X2 [Eublepharis macularius]|uniref:ATPase WRNIP1 n=1 Tax=Eublepharis macularius TaxID=481883 RepID=A0AA97JMY6_EUBMA|nr:ATPase WRNIP1 isoform X2 [Eublepharis macularius]
MEQHLVSCPVCSHELPAPCINSHLDKCLQGKGGDDPVSEGGGNGSSPKETGMGLQQPCKKKMRRSKSPEGGKREEEPGSSLNTLPVFSLFQKGRGCSGAGAPLKGAAAASPSRAEKQLHREDPGISPRASVPELGGENLAQKLEGKPLADKLRPDTLSDYMGQDQVVGEQTLLRSLLEAHEIPSLIFWGPPGCGKDTFLPHVECGTLTLIGATTENPSFQVNSALLSRCRVIVLEKLSVEAMEAILMRALRSLGIRILSPDEQHAGSVNGSNSEISESCICIERRAVSTLAYLCDGDARTGLNGLQMAIQAQLTQLPHQNNMLGHTADGIVITEDHVKEGLQRSHILYDRAGEEHYNCISALHKSMRGSDENASLYWLARMLEGGEDPLYVARRLVRFASEDIGLADPLALTQAVAAYQGCHFIGMPECEVILAQCVIYFARAPKSIEVYSAYGNVKACLRNHEGPLPPVPLHLRNAPTRLMKDLSYGKGYKYNPMYKEPVDQDYLPEELKGVDFFRERRM